MVDRLIAFFALATLIVFLGIIVVFVPDPDLAIVSMLALAMAGFDFYRTLFKRKAP